MKIVIPLEGAVHRVMDTPFLHAYLESNGQYKIDGQALKLEGIAQDQVLILPDSIEIEEGEAVTDELLTLALPLDYFLSIPAEQTAADALGLVLRAPVAAGKISDAELLRIAPALEARLWQPRLEVYVGDVYSWGSILWRCVQGHTTQGDWPPDLAPALWRKVEVIDPDAPRVWNAGLEYAAGDIVAYPDAKSARFECIQPHVSQVGWEPSNAPALWVLLE